MVYGSDPPADRVAMALAVRQRDGRAPRPCPWRLPRVYHRRPPPPRGPPSRNPPLRGPRSSRCRASLTF